MRSALLTVLALAAAACSSPTSPTADLRAETKVSAATLRPGDSVTVSVVVTNHGKVKRRIELPSGCVEPFVVTRTNGIVVGPADKLCAGILVLHTRELAPGESVTLTRSWAGDARSGSFQYPPPLLPPGTYRIRARVPAEGSVIDGTPVAIQMMP